MHFTLASFTSLLSPVPPTIYRNSRGGVGGIQVFSQQSAVMNLQTLPLRIQLIPNDQHVAVVQVMHHLRHTWSPCCRQLPTHDRIIGSVRVAGIICCAYTQRLACHQNALHSRPPRPSPFITVLVMWSSLKGATPTGPRRSPAGLTSRLDPVMVIFGSLGGSTITTALMSGMEIQVSSPKHLRSRINDWTATVLGLYCRFVSMQLLLVLLC